MMTTETAAYASGDPRRYTCPQCGNGGSAYVCRADVWRYTCGKGHTWAVSQRV